MINKLELPDFLMYINGVIQAKYRETYGLTEHWNAFVDAENIKFENERLELKAQITALEREKIVLECHIDSMNESIRIKQNKENAND